MLNCCLPKDSHETSSPFTFLKGLHLAQQWVLVISNIMFGVPSDYQSLCQLVVKYFTPRFVHNVFCLFVCFVFFFPFIFIHWRLITLQYCSGFGHTLTWISHGFTCVPHPDPRSRLPLHPIPLGLPSAPALSTHLMHPTWAGGLFHPW